MPNPLLNPETYPDEFRAWIRGQIQSPAMVLDRGQLPAPFNKIRNLVFGAATLTWPGGSPFTTALNVSHNMGVVPTVVVCAPGGASAVIEGYSPINVGGFTATQFTIAARTVDGSNPVNGHTLTVYWLAIAA